MTSTFARWGARLALALLAVVPASASAQMGNIPGPDELVKSAVEPVHITAGGTANATVRLVIAPSWHINANPPFPDYMIPTELSLDSSVGVTSGEPTYPPPHMVRLSFDDSDLFVYDGTAEIVLPLVASAQAVNGTHTLRAELRFQACNDQVCLPPATVPVMIEVTVDGGIAGPTETGSTAAGQDAGRSASPDLAQGGTLDVGGQMDRAPDASAPPAGTGFTTGPPPAGSTTSPAIENPIARALEQGSWATFVTLFLIGLALNLTPCVYPMIGVTASIFGARGKTPPLQAFGMALIYVLGIAVMYSALGLAAALSGGIFGAALQSPIVLLVIGGLLVALSLSMFGLYELQVPSGIMMRLGGQTTTGAVGVFLSGLLVGVFAAPCIGPPIVALLAIVGAKGDPVFGFTSFFILSLGLGAPYLVLGTFSNLLSSLPKSGEWMVWVKKVFGVILLAIGVFYALLAFAPDAAYWVPPIALLVGGAYLGFIEKSKGRTPVFGWVKRISGVAGIIAGVFAVSLVMPSQTIAFQDVTDGDIQVLAASGKPVLVDFTADWCVPCHELERFTFTDKRVIAAARDFHTLRVDLTRYDSPEAEQWRTQYEITGVPTIVFLLPDGRELREARVEGFLPPEPFLERMQMAVGQTARR